MGFNSFVDFITTHCDTDRQKQENIESFRAFDVENTGHASSADIREILLDVMKTCSTEDKDMILQVFRLNEDRQVSFEGTSSTACQTTYSLNNILSSINDVFSSDKINWPNFGRLLLYSMHNNPKQESRSVWYINTFVTNIHAHFAKEY